VQGKNLAVSTLTDSARASLVDSLHLPTTNAGLATFAPLRGTPALYGY